MGNNQNPAIELLVAQITELERKANAYRASVNVLCERDGVPPMYPDSGGDGGGGTKGVSHSHRATVTPTAQIKPDMFYGKPQQTAVREYLGFRNARGDGPAKPAEILAGLRAGGYQVEAKNDDIALVGLRAMLRKRTAVFHKLPNGTWGLREWYPNAKAHKEASDKGGSPSKSVDTDEDEIPAGDDSGSDTKATDKQTAATPKGATAA
jgi:hypothetical protein